MHNSVNFYIKKLVQDGFQAVKAIDDLGTNWLYLNVVLKGSKHVLCLSKNFNYQALPLPSHQKSS